MDENKNINPEESTAPEESITPEENTAPEENIAPEESATTEESIAPEEDTASEENTTTEESIAPEEDTASEESIAPEAEAKKKKKGGIFAIIAAAVVIIAAAVGIFMSFNRGASEGSGNMLSQGFAAVKGSDLYHVDFSDYKLHKTNLKTGESELLSDDYAVYITNYKNNIYYLGYKPSEDSESYVYEYKKYVDGVNDKVIFSDEISSPQLTGGYIYYLKSVPEFHSGYSSRLYRASLSGGSESELVCDALMVSYYVDGNDLYYCDVESTSLVKVSLDAVS